MIRPIFSEFRPPKNGKVGVFLVWHKTPQIWNGSWGSSSGLRGHRRTYFTILNREWSANFKMVWYVLLRPRRPELDGQDPFQICGILCQTRKTPTLVLITEVHILWPAPAPTPPLASVGTRLWHKYKIFPAKISNPSFPARKKYSSYTNKQATIVSCKVTCNQYFRS
jgi:hypothetical protein